MVSFAETPEGRTADPELEKAVLAARLQQSKAIEDYSATRNRVVLALSARGLSEDQIDDVLEAFESMQQAGFGQGFDQGTQSERPGAVRKAVDDSLRNGLDPTLYDAFTAAYNDYRRANNTVHEAEAMVYSFGGSGASEVARRSTASLLSMRSDIAGFAKQINPAIKIDAAYGLVGASPADVDPLRNILTVSLTANPKREIAENLFHQLEPLLGDKEIKLLEDMAKSDKRLTREKQDKFNPSDLKNMMATLFAEHLVPKDRDAGKPPSFIKPIKNFLGRVKNLANGHGFQTADDVLSRLGTGKVAERAKKLPTGIMVPNKASHAERHKQIKGSIAKKTDIELADMLKNQHDAIAGLLKETHSVRAKIFGRVLSREPGFLSKEGRNEYEAKHRQLQELQRGRVLLVQEMKERSNLAVSIPELGENSPGRGPSGPDGGIGASFRKDGHFVGRDGMYRLGAQGQSNNVVFLNPTEKPDVAIPLGEFPDNGAAASFVTSFDRVRSSSSLGEEPTVSSTAMKLADAATRRSTGDIALIRNSGLLDKDLDQALSSADSKAFVYPLTTGDLIYQDPTTKAWKADSREGFVEFAGRSGDRHLVAAAKVLENENKGYVQGSNLAVQAEKSEVIRAKSKGDARKKIDGMTPDVLKRSFIATRDEYKNQEGRSTPEAIVARAQLMNGLSALKSAMQTQDAMQEQQKPKQRARGQGR